MGKFSKVFFASDFDHTITNRQGAVPQKNIDAIRYFIEEGGIFCVASGRSIPMFGSRHAQVPSNAPCILYNGAACFDYTAGTLYYARPLGAFASELREKVARDYPDLTVEIQGLKFHYVTTEDGWRADFLRSQNVPYHCGLDAIDEPQMKVVITDGVWRLKSNDPKDVPVEYAARFDRIQRELAAFCGASAYVTRSMPTVIEICAAGVSKGKSARTLANQMGRPILVCAGDAPNDETMLREADFAFSPADRDPGLQGDFFREVISCNDGAVAHAIGQLETLLKERDKGCE